MNIGIIAVDSTYPNLALMKISAYYKRNGDNVEWYTPFGNYDKVYMSKIFNFTTDYGQYITNADCIEKGGTGYSIEKVLPKEIEYIQPDYNLYNLPDDIAYGFLTRGCTNKCKWCIVPRKEGNITPYMDIEEVSTNGRNRVILFDNNILASDYGISQIEKIIRINEKRKRNEKIKLDFNQALDARLVTDDIAELLARLKWIDRIRFGCDTDGQVSDCERAISMIDAHGYKGEYFFYCILIDDFEKTFKRVNHWRNKGRRYLTHCQPYRDPIKVNTKIPQWQKDLSMWSNKKEYFRSCEFDDFSPRKGFKCSEYFTTKKIEFK